MTTKQYENIELAFLQSQFVTAKNISKIRTLPYAFTRNGVGMLSSVLGSETAVDMNDGKYGKLVFLEHAAKIRKERQTSKYFVDNLTHWEKMIIFATTNNSGMA